MNDQYDFEDEDFDFDDEESYRIKRVSEMTEGEKLQRFKRFFDSSSRAMLQECLFRVVPRGDGIDRLEILCPNELIQQRLARKNRKIRSTINTCWRNVKCFSLCVEKDGELICETFTHAGYEISQ
ncbi:MAG: hypothetical protein ACHBN1_06635 [Heteroscytonema crispum UTEX LB 1556]